MDSVAQPKRLGEVAIDQDIGRPARFAAGPAGFEIAGQQLVHGKVPARRRIIRIDGQRFRVERKGFIEPMLFDQRKRLVGHRRRHASDSARASDRSTRSPHRSGRTSDGRCQDCRGFRRGRGSSSSARSGNRPAPRRTASRARSKSAHLVEGRAIWLDLVALIEIGQRFVIAFQIEQQLRAGARSLQMARIELQGMLKTQHGLVANAPA